MKTVYEFVGGKYNGKRMNYEQVLEISNGKYSANWSEERRYGMLVPREELDSLPLVTGYLSPMYDGQRYVADGKIYYDFEYKQLPEPVRKSREEAGLVEVFNVIRYETQDVYDMLSV